MIALGSEGQPLSLRQRQRALDRRQIRLYDVPRAAGIRPDGRVADPDAERRGRVMIVEGHGLSILTPNHPTIQTSIAGIML
jgi:hypothetical protein